MKYIRLISAHNKRYFAFSSGDVANVCRPSPHPVPPLHLAPPPAPQGCRWPISPSYSEQPPGHGQSGRPVTTGAAEGRPVTTGAAEGRLIETSPAGDTSAGGHELGRFPSGGAGGGVDREETTPWAAAHASRPPLRSPRSRQGRVGTQRRLKVSLAAWRDGWWH